MRASSRSSEPGGETRVDIGELAGDLAPEQLELPWRGRGRLDEGTRDVELEACLLADRRERLVGMGARELEAPPLRPEAEDTAACDEGGRRASRADEVDLRHEHPPRVLLAEEEHLRDERIEVGGAERAGEAPGQLRIVAQSDEVEVALAVDLRSAQEEGVDPPLRGGVEQLAAA